MDLNSLWQVWIRHDGIDEDCAQISLRRDEFDTDYVPISFRHDLNTHCISHSGTSMPTNEYWNIFNVNSQGQSPTYKCMIEFSQHLSVPTSIIR